MIVEEAIVDNVTSSLPVEGQLKHLGRLRALCEAFHRDVFQHRVVSKPTEKVDLQRKQMIQQLI